MSTQPEVLEERAVVGGRAKLVGAVFWARWKNKPRLESYLASSGWCPLESIEVRTEDLHRAERFLLGLRLQEGSAFTNLPASTLDPGPHEKPRFDRWSNAALLRLGPNGWH